MKTICAEGYKTSAEDQKALEHFLTITDKQWAQAALDGMINKSVKNILKRWLEPYKATGPAEISGDIAVLLPAIMAMPAFEMSKIKTPPTPTINRTNPATIEQWEGGFQVEDHEYDALCACYADPEAMLYWFMNNNIADRRGYFVKEYEQKYIREKQSFPSNEDALIDQAIT